MEGVAVNVNDGRESEGRKKDVREGKRRADICWEGESEESTDEVMTALHLHSCIHALKCILICISLMHLHLFPSE